MSRPLPDDLRDKFARAWGVHNEYVPDLVLGIPPQIVDLDQRAANGFLISHPDFTYHPDNCDGGCGGTVEVWHCRNCGPHPGSNHRWCDKGCGSDHGGMTLVPCPGTLYVWTVTE